MSRKAGLPSSAMSPEEAEEMFSRSKLLFPKRRTDQLSPYIPTLRLGTLVYGTSVGSAKRRPRLSIRRVLQECKQRLSGGYLSSAQRISVGRIHLGKRCFDLSGLGLKLLNCAKLTLYCCLP